MSSGDLSRPAPPEIEGYLSKLKSKFSLFGSWAKRYYRLNPETGDLDYYSDKSSRTAAGTISLANLLRVMRFDETSFQIEAPPHVILLRAESQAELACWLQALEQYLEEKTRFERYTHSKEVEERERRLKGH